MSLFFFRAGIVYLDRALRKAAALEAVKAVLIQNCLELRLVRRPTPNDDERSSRRREKMPIGIRGWEAVVLGAVLRFLLFSAFPAFADLLSGQVEVSTPVSSYKRCTEACLRSFPQYTDFC